MNNLTKSRHLVLIIIFLFLFSIRVVASETTSQTNTSPITQTTTTPSKITENKENKIEKNINDQNTSKRSYSLNLSSGLTTFSGNRGLAYEDKYPSLGLSFFYFFNPQMAIGLGTAYSKHYMIVDIPTKAFNQPGGPGAIEVNMFEYFLSYRYYANTDAGTLKTLNQVLKYTNPYLTSRLEYWNQTNKYIDFPNTPSDSSGSFGVAFGGGLEFPIKTDSAYIGLEGLYHFVTFKDENTKLYQPIDGSEGGGYENLSGNVISLFASLVASW
ncbi:MAG: hypothetical protein HQK49_20170 [Oligoflexia bacterium]|nr:hypothetical protein [Oligoflexia bacterium]